MSPEDIDKLTIAEVRAIAERAGDALKTLRELGLTGPAVVSAPMTVPRGTAYVLPVASSTSPFPCPACGRAATEKPGEPCSPIECQLCGNHLPLPEGATGPRMSNKGPLVMDPEMQARRAALIAQPAFDAEGEPA
jgi:hypothetical protein